MVYHIVLTRCTLLLLATERRRMLNTEHYSVVPTRSTFVSPAFCRKEDAAVGWLTR